MFEELMRQLGRCSRHNVSPKTTAQRPNFLTFSYTCGHRLGRAPQPSGSPGRASQPSGSPRRAPQPSGSPGRAPQPSVNVAEDLFRRRSSASFTLIKSEKLKRLEIH